MKCDGGSSSAPFAKGTAICGGSAGTFGKPAAAPLNKAAAPLRRPANIDVTGRPLGGLSYLRKPPASVRDCSAPVDSTAEPVSTAAMTASSTVTAGKGSPSVFCAIPAGLNLEKAANVACFSVPSKILSSNATLRTKEGRSAAAISVGFSSVLKIVAAAA